jgi:hypothetical protein
MPLLDHFHEPMNPRATWESFHTRWAVAIADYLDRTLPGRFYAKVQVHLGYQVEADVAEFDGLPDAHGNGAAGGLATLTYKQAVIDVWPSPLGVGQQLPSVPLPLRGAGCVKLELEATYLDACQRSRII